MKPCLTCNGSKIRVREAFTFEGKSYPETREPCYTCKGTGEFAPPDGGTVQ